jgi:hypothetical protein
MRIRACSRHGENVRRYQPHNDRQAKPHDTQIVEIADDRDESGIRSNGLSAYATTNPARALAYQGVRAGLLADEFLTIAHRRPHKGLNIGLEPAEVIAIMVHPLVNEVLHAHGANHSRDKSSPTHSSPSAHHSWSQLSSRCSNTD